MRDNLTNAGSFKVLVKSFGLVKSEKWSASSLRDNQGLDTIKLAHVQEDIIYELSTLNLGPVKAFNILRTKYGGFEEVVTTKDDCKNFKQRLNCFIGEFDAEMVVQRLSGKKRCCDEFSFEYTVNDNGELARMFWANEISKKNYLEFGDIISFDATFKTNKYKMVFAPFTAIDNHCRNVTVGAGLLASESIGSYTWCHTLT
ncbi:protein FAR1-RELATED SEQUENCE 5-like [Bidens hawaiensis]|uniref:protein FAR1-RELATED SEQUENCE 5-like n=1 Tax=Bidens hawaiensis TaxID=980011 RepID=UPI00404B4241